ncbi:hypothetical protein K458DRAFT_416739 [Lentithecium fluviatile CBS 122367]|uniref:Uncharacterized protein n=1 Tax=Lentithecium fluviatile CBS 122367 TaxID=1168545 RepID=A0A6G1J4Q6_9PLEO|nr:hypothetical protein K458DRAFT_416739 [Lentithecium fluviatile CBS 122367]
MIEPGLYLLAACALSFKPLFRMLGRALHLSQLITYTKSSLGKTFSDRKTNATGPGTVIRMDTFKSGSSGGFTKLGEGKDGDGDFEGEVRPSKDIEEGNWIGKEVEVGKGHKKGVSDGAISVMVTRTVEVESESVDGDVELRFNAADQSFFHDMLDDLDRRADSR